MAGEAKRRGDFEARKAQAIARKQQELIEFQKAAEQQQVLRPEKITKRNARMIASLLAVGLSGNFKIVP